MQSDVVVHVIDDDVAVRKSLAFLLASEGIPVRLHESASGFLDDAPRMEVGCIVTDVRMPGLEGGRHCTSGYRHDRPRGCTDGRRSHEGRCGRLPRKAFWG